MHKNLSVANKSLEVAEHMLIKTYPMVNDPKVLLAILEDIYTAVMEAISEVAKGESFREKMAAFSQFAKSHDIDTGFIEEMHSILEQHKESPVEFARKDKFVICDASYACKVVEYSALKRYLFKAKNLVSCVGRAVL
ncbi:hypothetical protein KY362_04685 [Candidatus Woesearchaeota archaeon]|nr:hypothetical protein [Candidatus Woesearchaeota archaeon]